MCWWGEAIAGSWASNNWSTGVAVWAAWGVGGPNHWNSNQDKASAIEFTFLATVGAIIVLEWHAASKARNWRIPIMFWSLEVPDHKSTTALLYEQNSTHAAMAPKGSRYDHRKEFFIRFGQRCLQRWPMACKPILFKNCAVAYCTSCIRGVSSQNTCMSNSCDRRFSDNKLANLTNWPLVILLTNFAWIGMYPGPTMKALLTSGGRESGDKARQQNRDERIRIWIACWLSYYLIPQCAMRGNKWRNNEITWGNRGRQRASGNFCDGDA